MGRGGISPEYFLHKMSWPEVILYLEGMDQRDMASWQQMRMQTVMVLNGIGAKKKDGSPLTLQDIIELPGDVPHGSISKEEEDKTNKLLDQLYEINQKNKKKSTT